MKIRDKVKLAHHFGGWKKQLPDFRDFKLVPMATLAPLPAVMDLRPSCPPVYDQGQLGSCTANAIAGAFEFETLRQGLPDFTPARLFIYYNERVIEGDVSQDNGAQIRDGMKSIASQGICPETDWPYDVGRFAVKPLATCYTDALKNKAIQYFALAQDLNSLKACLASGFPFVFGISVFDSFESPDVASTGMVPMPAPTESCLGGHAILCVGYDDSKQAFIFRNSWGASWALGGYAYIPYAYLTNGDMASDFWTLRSVA